MSDGLKPCFLCVAAEAMQQHTAAMVLEAREGTHAGEPFYLVRIDVGGDKALCQSVVDALTDYMNNVLKIPTAYAEGDMKRGKTN